MTDNRVSVSVALKCLVKYDKGKQNELVDYLEVIIYVIKGTPFLGNGIVSIDPFVTSFIPNDMY